MMPPARPRSPFLEVNCTNVVNLAENVVNRMSSKRWNDAVFKGKMQLMHLM